MRALIVEDDAISAKIMERNLNHWGYEALWAGNGRAAWELIQSEHLRLVIADWMMPEMDGLTLCRTIRAAELGYYVYILLLTSKDGKEDLISGLSSGADDYLTKPVHPDELQVRLRSAKRVLNLEDELTATRTELIGLASTDELSGLLNRRTVLDRLVIEMERCPREKSPLSVIMLDIDHFKQVNDCYGHCAGDKALTHVAERIRKSCRPYDLTGRYGGDEFLIVAPGADLPKAITLTERIRRKVSETPITLHNSKIWITCSLGVTDLNPSGNDTIESLIDRADSAAYESKAAGRNRVSSRSHAQCDAHLDEASESHREPLPLAASNSESSK